jgi:hypothetical protein
MGPVLVLDLNVVVFIYGVFRVPVRFHVVGGIVAGGIDRPRKHGAERVGLWPSAALSPSDLDFWTIKSYN